MICCIAIYFLWKSGTQSLPVNQPYNSKTKNEYGLKLFNTSHSHFLLKVVKCEHPKDDVSFYNT